MLFTARWTKALLLLGKNKIFVGCLVQPEANLLLAALKELDTASKIL